MKNHSSRKQPGVSRSGIEADSDDASLRLRLRSGRLPRQRDIADESFRRLAAEPDELFAMLEDEAACRPDSPPNG